MKKITRVSVCLISCLAWGIFQLTHSESFHSVHAEKISHARLESSEGKARSNQKIAEAITDFRAQTASITRTMILEEQKRIHDAREHYEDFADEPLHAELIKDEYGMKWRRLSTSDGRIRYELPDQG